MSKRKRKTQSGGRKPRRNEKVAPAEKTLPDRSESAPNEMPKKNHARRWLLAAVIGLFVARPLMPSESVSQEGEGTVLVMFSLLLLVAWSVYLIQQAKSFLRIGLTDVAVLLLLVIHSVSAVWAAQSGNARAAINMLWAWIGLGVGFFLLRQLLRSAREARAVIVVMIALGTALSGYGLYQYTIELPEVRKSFQRDPEGMLRAEGLWYEPGSVSREHLEQRLASREPYATFALTNSLAGYLAPWLAMAIGLAALGGVARCHAQTCREHDMLSSKHAHDERGHGTLSAEPQEGCRKIANMLAGVLLVVVMMGACLLLTKSRSAWLALLLGLGLIATMRLMKRRALGWRVPVVGAAIIVALIVGAVAVGGLDKEVFSEAGKSIGYRVQYWQSTLAMIEDHPWLGCGPGQFQNAYTLYKLPEASEEISDPHNFVFEIWATTGTLGLLALLGVLGCFGWVLWKNRWQDVSDTQLKNNSGWLGHSAAVAQGQKDQALTPFVSGHPRSTEVEPSDDASRWVYGGAAAGFLVAWPLGILGTTMPSMSLLWMGLPLAVVTVILLAGWVRHGRLTVGVLVVGLVVLLVNLLAAGGIGFPGVAGTFWVLLAIGLFVAQGQSGMSLSQVGSFGVAGMALVLAGACYWTAYRPVLSARGHTVAALYATEDRQSHLLTAAEADPLWPKPYRELVLANLRDWKETRSSDSLERLEQYAAKSSELNPRSNAWWNTLGDGYMEVYGYTSDGEYLKKALDAYGRTVELYPNNAKYHANLAIALQLADRSKAARQEAKTALHLDDTMPHADKKLPAKLRNQLLRMEMGP